jgi:hypothetical protein
MVPLSFLFTGCFVWTYNVRPESAWKLSKPTKPRRKDTLYYQVRRVPNFTLGGYSDLYRAVSNNGVFAHTEEREEPPSKGIFVKVATSYVEPTIGELTWGYIASFTLFFLPAYTWTGGFRVRYYVYIDGHKIRTYQYDIYRKALVWLPLVAFMWINLFTDYEGDAFEAVTKQFFKDALKDGTFDQRPKIKDSISPGESSKVSPKKPLTTPSDLPETDSPEKPKVSPVDPSKAPPGAPSDSLEKP